MEIPRRSMRARTAHERMFQSLVYVVDALGSIRGFQRLPEPQRQVGAFGGIFRGFVDHHAIEGELWSSRAW